MPVCIHDLLDNNIRTAGQRNLAVLTLTRYCKAAKLSQAEEMAQSRSGPRMKSDPEKWKPESSVGMSTESSRSD